MSVIASDITAPDTLPDGPESLWTKGGAFIHNWANPFELTSTWPTKLGSANTESEKRSISTGKPNRTMRYSIQSTTLSESQRVRNTLMRMGYSRTAETVYSDYATLDSPSSGAVLSCDTTLRRLYAGARVFIGAPFSGSTSFSQSEYQIINSITDSSITLESSPSVVYPIGSRVFPVIECDLWAESSARQIGGGKLATTVLASEIPGGSALPPSANPGDSIGFGTYGGYPIFDPGFNRNIEWRATDDGWKRDSTSSQVGQGRIYNLWGIRPRMRSSRSVAAYTREDAWSLIQFWDMVRGPTFPFFAPTPFPLLEPRAITTTTIDVTSVGELVLTYATPYIAVVKRQGDSAAARIRPISSVTRSMGVDTITVSDPFDAMTIDEVAYVVPAALMRFENQDFTERWKNARSLSAIFNLIELLSEQTVSLSNL